MRFSLFVFYVWWCLAIVNRFVAVRVIFHLVAQLTWHCSAMLGYFARCLVWFALKVRLDDYLTVWLDVC